MKKINQTILMLLVLVFATTSCRKSYEQLVPNNNVPSNVPASLLLQGIVTGLPDLPDSQYEIWDQYQLYNYDYYGNNRYDFGNGTFYYTTVNNVILMEQAAAKAGLSSVKGYTALGEFFRAYFFYKMTMQMGDIPLSQALQGKANLTPVYDPQKAVFVQILKWLEASNTDLAAAISSGVTTVDGDIYFGGDLSKWRKVVNAFHLRVLTQLSKKSADADLGVATQFAAIIGDPTKYPLMTSSDDNLQYVFLSPTNYYPQTPDNFGQNAGRKNSSSTYISLLTANSDPRVFVNADPAPLLIKNGASPTAFSSFVGADPGLDLGVMYNNAILGQYSFIGRRRFYSTYIGEPSIQVGFPEQQFNIAEGINRGWGSGDAEAYYTSGIKASIQSYGIPLAGNFSASFYRAGATKVEVPANYDNYTIAFDYPTYYSQPSVKYAAGATGLSQILTQKYLALFRHSGLESYYTYRRTGLPAFSKGGSGTGNSGRIALRFTYPNSELTANTVNYNAALKTQFNGIDDINGVMYILQ